MSSSVSKVQVYVVGLLLPVFFGLTFAESGLHVSTSACPGWKSSARPRFVHPLRIPVYARLRPST